MKSNFVKRVVTAVLCAFLAFSVYGEGQKLYVDLNGGNRAPYDSWDNAATSLQDALAIAEDDAVITIRSGNYEYSGTILLTNAVTIVSENKDYDSVILNCTTAGSAAFVKVNNAGAVLSSISLTGKSNASVYGLHVVSGMVTNSLVFNVKPTLKCPPIVLEGGTIVDSMLTNSSSYTTSANPGVVRITGDSALFERCKVIDCVATRGGNGNGAGINITKGTVRDCFISGCRADGSGGGIYADGTAKIYNTTVVNCRAAIRGGGIYKAKSTAVIENCIEWNNAATGCLEAFDDPGFIDPKNGDFRLNKASYYAGSGCYEALSTDDISLAFTRESVFAPCAVTVRAVAPAGVNLDEAQSYWTFDGREPSADDYDAKGITVTYTITKAGAATVKFKTTIVNGDTVSVNKPDWIKTLSKVIYLRKTNADAKAPYVSYESAATSFTEALKYLRDGVTLLVDEGTYSFSGMTLSKTAEIRSLQGPEKTILDGGGVNHNLDNITISGFTFIKGATGQGGAGCMNFNSGILTNCIFSGLNNLRGNPADVINMTGGLIVDSVFTNCYNNGNYNNMANCAIVISASAGLIDRCLFVDCYRNPNNRPDSKERGPCAIVKDSAKIRSCVFDDCMSNNGGALWVRSGASAENCTILNSEAQGEGYAAGIRTDSGAVVKNCIAVMNTNSFASAEMNISVMDGATVERCVSTENAGTDSVAVPEVLFSAKKRAPKYSLPSGSKLRNAGVYDAAWMNTAKDFYGNQRKFGAGVDIGAVECILPYPTVIKLQ